MEYYYKSYSSTGQLGSRISGLPMNNGHIDFETTHTSCRDVCCIVFFFITAIIGLAIFIYAVAVGRPKKLYNPVDSTDGICGFNFNNVNNEGKPYLAELVGNNLKICVNECPSKEKNCVCPGRNPSNNMTSCGNDCLDFEGVKYEPVMDYCRPSESFDSTVPSQIARDVIMRIWVVAVALAIAFALSFLYIILLMYLAYYIIWGTIIIVLIGLILLALVFIIIGAVIISRAAEGAQAGGIILIVLGVITLIIFAIALCVICFIKSRINLCITIIKEACSGIKAMPGMLLVPVIFTLLDAAVYTLFIVGVIFLMGTYPITVTNGVRTIEDSSLRSFLYVVDTLLILFISLICVGLAQSVIAGALAAWYFTHDRENRENGMPKYPVLSAFKRTFRYSFGTICFGSLIIVIITALRMAAESMKQQNRRDNGGNGNVCCALLLCCCMCLLGMAEKFFSFINSRAYILAALTGKGFIDCAKDAFFLLLRNIIRTMVLESIKNIPICLGSVFIFLITAFITLIVCNPLIFSSNSSNLNGYISQYWWLVYIIAILVIIFVIVTVMETITYAVDTIFIFFLVDEEYTASNNTGQQNYGNYSSPDMQSGMAQTYQMGAGMAGKYDIAVPADIPYYVTTQNGGTYYKPGAASSSPYSSPSTVYPTYQQSSSPDAGQYYGGYPPPPPETGQYYGGYPPPPVAGQQPFQPYPSYGVVDPK